jgi:hypothetical protein
MLHGLNLGHHEFEEFGVKAGVTLLEDLDGGFLRSVLVLCELNLRVGTSSEGAQQLVWS